MKIKNLCSSKDAVKRMKRQTIDVENHTWYIYLTKNFYPEYKDLLQFNNHKINFPFGKISESNTQFINHCL